MDPVASPPAVRQTPPGAVGSLVCGIIAVVTAWLPIAGIVLGIIAIVLASKAAKAVATQPTVYAPSGMRTAGFVLGIIGVVWSAIITIMWAFITTVAVKAPGALENFTREMEKQRLEREAREREAPMDR